MDINDVRGLGSIFALIAFSGVIWWAYGASRKQRFEDDAKIPFGETDDGLPLYDEKDRSK